MEKLSNFQKGLNQLNAPYKKSDAYVIFGNKKSCRGNVSSFWDTDAGFVDKYKNAKMNNNSTK